MSKAILVLNEVPKRCMECPFAYEYEQMYFCKTLQKITGTKKDECPLKPMPEKKEAHTYSPVIGYFDYDDIYGTGYNDCINEIIGEEE